MTKPEAILLMQAGVKVSHRHFSDEEWMLMKNNKIITEEGYSHPFDEFWSYRTDESWNDGYYEYKESVKHEHLTTQFPEYEKEMVNIFNTYPENSYEDLPLAKELKHGHYAPIRTTPKTGRNEPCPCGSKLKYKKCCINKS